MSETNVLKKKYQRNSYVSSIVFLVFVLLLTIGLKFYNNSVIDDVTQLKSKSETVDLKIQEVSKDKRVEVYSLLMTNEKTMNYFIARSNLTDYMNHMNEMSEKYGLEFSGFNMNGGEVTTKIASISGENGIAYQKVSRFIQEYRADDSRLFDLGFVSGVNGGLDSMKFNVNLKVK